MKKKGVSPLIATVLIIGFTIALAAIIITWSTGFTKRMQSATEETANIQVVCATDVVFDIKSVCKKPTTKDYNLLIANDGKEDIKSWIIRIYESPDSVETAEFEKPISKFGIGTVLVNTTFDAVQKFEVFPVIDKSGKKIPCSSNLDAYGEASSTPGAPFLSTLCT